MLAPRPEVTVAFGRMQLLPGGAHPQRRRRVRMNGRAAPIGLASSDAEADSGAPGMSIDCHLKQYRCEGSTNASAAPAIHGVMGRITAFRLAPRRLF